MAAPAKPAHLAAAVYPARLDAAAHAGQIPKIHAPRVLHSLLTRRGRQSMGAGGQHFVARRRPRALTAL
jgi:hypothetical protein